MEQKDFWDKLHLDIITSNQKLDDEDYRMFVERNFMFSIFFRGCDPLEITCFQKMFGVGEYGYVIIFEINELNKTNGFGEPIDEIRLYRLVRNSVTNSGITIGPLIVKRFSILVSHDSPLEESELLKESYEIADQISRVITKEYNISVKTGIGSMQGIISLYSSLIDALACMYLHKEGIANYIECKNQSEDNRLDYLETEKHLLEAVRLKKTESYDYLGIIMEGLKPLCNDAKRNKIIEILILTNHAMQLDNRMDLKQIDYSEYIRQIMELEGNELIEFAFRCFIYITSYVKPQTTIDYTNHIVKATREYLESHYTDDISLEDMAAQVNISPQYFSKLIKKTTGFNFIDWLSMLRVKRAKELLTNSNLTVKEVCFMVGYKDPNYFSRIFKKRIGITPSEYVKTSSYLNNKS
jgi:two-component system response regulator YesN